MMKDLGLMAILFAFKKFLFWPWRKLCKRKK